VGLFLAGLVGFNLIASVLPNSATFKQPAAQSTAEPVVGPLQDPKITLLDGPRKFFGVTNWGFTAQNELFAGRLAALGIAAAIVGELYTGLGPVGQLSAGETQSQESRLDQYQIGLLACCACLGSSVSPAVLCMRVLV
jgi:hypothetical protein